MKIKSVFVIPPTLGADDDDVFPKHGYILAKTPEDADALVFCGGADIDPAFYNQKPISGTYHNPNRDRNEKMIYDAFKGKPMIGICRGAQFLNVMAGGTLWQNVNNHGWQHPIEIYDQSGNLVGKGVTNSVHHQQMRPGPLGVVLGVARESTMREDQFNREHKPSGETFQDVEIVWYPEFEYYCFQAHPEFGHAATTALFFKHMKELYI